MNFFSYSHHSQSLRLTTPSHSASNVISPVVFAVQPPKFNFIRVSLHPWMVSRGAVRPPPVTPMSSLLKVRALQIDETERITTPQFRGC